MQLSLENFNNVLLLYWFYFLSQINHLLFYIDQSPHIPTDFTHFQRININNFTTNRLNLDIRFVGYLIDKVSDSQFRTFRQNIQYMFALDETWVFDALNNIELVFTGDKLFVFVLLSRLLK